MGSCLDLRKLQSDSAVQDAYSLLVSGKKGYKAVIERRKVPPRCVKCNRPGDDGVKFCSQCGGEMKTPLTNCPGCQKDIGDTEKFCTQCGHKLRD
jgi:predicted amidophosphoribosyltransferase